MDQFVVDASIAIGWVHPSQATDESDEWLAHVSRGATIIVPAIWPLEMANVLLVLQRRRKLTAAERDEALRALRDLPVEIDHESSERVFGDVSELAASATLSVYDASYLDVAVRRSLPLGCKDGPLRTAAMGRRLQVTP